jgi:hypothetical protein
LKGDKMAENEPREFVVDCTGYTYNELEFLLELFKKTTNGIRFLSAAKAIHPAKEDKELILIWFSFKVMYNNR